ncbi:MAG: putative ABC transporter ATP-binding protein YheS [candidate division WS6 bacterium OLB20]|uniref:Putative ABC transporter ATP-binding protein YheS n=1 Tax=candidate division WS6 bacterium OLB20 TaxID=1617426 RepID=A0A136LWM6_9BACT|nr:MAG: putative ABC transporter ATP-binding protein YheS [candidate division WS6 bacterium OLB20]
MSKQDTVVRFENVSFKYGEEKVILNEVNFNVRRHSKITIMGQNGAGKSTIFKLLMGKLKPQSGKIHIDQSATVAIAEQVVPEEMMDLTLLEYFKTAFAEENYKIEKDIANVFEIVNLDLPLDKNVRDLSGGQKARLLLAYALIQEPDILLLDEPTNNLDKEGIEHLTNFLTYYWNTCIVISHDADFLNAFTDGVLNVDVYTKKVEQFVGNYFDVIDQISAHIERQRLQNARITKSIKDRFEKVNKLGGKSVAMRRLANKVRKDIEEDRENMVEIRRDDRTIPEFVIPYQHLSNPLVTIKEVTFLRDGKVQSRNVDKVMGRGSRMIISGPNGIGKSTLLKSFLDGKGVEFQEDLRIGYYSQDFSELDFDQTGIESLQSVAHDTDRQELFSIAGSFLLPGELLQNKVRSLSEGQKGLLCYARFVAQKPGLLIMDEPTNHINFRHLPVIAKAVSEFKGALILISHIPEFIEQIGDADEIDLTSL